jgi:hypothetical protein
VQVGLELLGALFNCVSDFRHAFRHAARNVRLDLREFLFAQVVLDARPQGVVEHVFGRHNRLR